MLLGLLVSCGLTPPEAQSLEACQLRADPVSCALQLLEEQELPPRELAGRIRGWGGDPASRDLLRLRLAVREPRRAGVLCPEMETGAAQERCRQVLGRPHLQQRRHE